MKSGDTLSKISKQFYGDSDEYMRIFYANRNELNDPDKIRVGQELSIPPMTTRNAGRGGKVEIGRRESARSKVRELSRLSLPQITPVAFAFDKRSGHRL